MANLVDQVKQLTEELISMQTDRDRQENFRQIFQQKAFEYRRRYHETVEALVLERLSHSRPPDQF